MVVWTTNCTVKFMSVDDHIAIIGSGNHGAGFNFYALFFPPILPLHVTFVLKRFLLSDRRPIQIRNPGFTRRRSTSW